MPLTAVLSISSEVLSVIYFTYRYRYAAYILYIGHADTDRH